MSILSQIVLGLNFGFVRFISWLYISISVYKWWEVLSDWNVSLINYNAVYLKKIKIKLRHLCGTVSDKSAFSSRAVSRLSSAVSAACGCPGAHVRQKKHPSQRYTSPPSPGVSEEGNNRLIHFSSGDKKANTAGKTTLVAGITSLSAALGPGWARPAGPGSRVRAAQHWARERITASHTPRFGSGPAVQPWTWVSTLASLG